MEQVAALLAQHGLKGPAFDPVGVATDLNAALEAARTLDELIDTPQLTDALRFDPRWIER